MPVDSEETSHAIAVRRVNVVYLPVATPSFSHLVVLGIGVFVSALVSAILLGIPSFLIPIPLPDKASAAIKIGLFIATILIGPAIWTYAYNSMRHKRIMKPTQYRTDRLSKIFTHSSARARLPHRWIEYLLRESPRGGRQAARFLPSVGSGHCIVIAPRGCELPLPQRRDLPFEPIEVSDAGDRAVQLCEQLFDPEGAYSSVSEPPSRANRPKSILRTVFYLLSFLPVVWLFLHFLVSPLLRGTSPNLVFVIALIVLGVAILCTALFLENRWWAAPGALLCRRMRRLGSRLDSFRYTPDTTPLLLDVRGNKGFVVGNGQVHRFDGTSIGCWLVLAGWLSEVRPPNELETRRFLGIES